MAGLTGPYPQEHAWWSQDPPSVGAAANEALELEANTINKSEYRTTRSKRHIDHATTITL